MARAFFLIKIIFYLNILIWFRKKKAQVSVMSNSTMVCVSITGCSNEDKCVHLLKPSFSCGKNI